MYPIIIQTISADRIREMHEKAEQDRQIRLARQCSGRLRRTGASRPPAILRMLPQSIRPRFT